MTAYRTIRVTEEIWTGKRWKRIKQKVDREPIPTLNERIVEFTGHL